MLIKVSCSKHLSQIKYATDGVAKCQRNIYILLIGSYSLLICLHLFATTNKDVHSHSQLIIQSNQNLSGKMAKHLRSNSFFVTKNLKENPTFENFSMEVKEKQKKMKPEKVLKERKIKTVQKFQLFRVKLKKVR